MKQFSGIQIDLNPPKTCTPIKRVCICRGLGLTIRAFLSTNFVIHSLDQKNWENFGIFFSPSADSSNFYYFFGNFDPILNIAKIGFFSLIKQSLFTICGL
jgi:hypothetical protein